MKKIWFVLVLVSVSLVLLYCSCDNRGGGNSITGPSYSLEVVPVVEETTPDEEVQMQCFVRDGVGNQVGDIMVKFESLDFGYITPEKESSATADDGLNGTVYYYPQGDFGENRIRVWSEEANITTEDTAIVIVSWYNLDLELEFDPVPAGESSQLYCRVFDPVDGLQMDDIRIRFYSMNFGDVPSVQINSSSTAISGLQSTVYYDAPADTFGTAILISNAVWGSNPEKIIGTDTLEVNVVEN